jgi:hypothetical protein
VPNILTIVVLPEPGGPKKINEPDSNSDSRSEVSYGCLITPIRDVGRFFSASGILSLEFAFIILVYRAKPVCKTKKEPHAAL